MSQTRSRHSLIEDRKLDEGFVPAPLRLRSLAAGFLLAIVVLLLSNCGATRPSKYYQLSPPTGLAAATGADHFPVTLVVGRLKSSHLYREDRIVYSGKGEEMGAYEFQRWTEPPTELIEQALVRGLGSSGSYQGVYSFGSESRGDFLLRGQLFDFKEVSGGALSGRVALDLELSDMKSGAVVWSHSYAHDEPVDKKEISSVVAALDRNVQQCVAEVRTSLDQYFSAHPAK